MAGLVLVSVLLGWRPVYSPDIGFYLDIGRQIVETGQIPHADDLTFTRLGTPVLFYQWLFCVAVWAAYSLSGVNLLIILTILGHLLAMGITAYAVKLRTGTINLATVLMLFVFAAGSLWEIRPHVVSWILLATILVCLEKHEAGRSGWLWGLPVAQALWVNMHSLFILGLAVIAIHLVGKLVARRVFDRRLAMFAGAAVMASFLTPYYKSVASYPILQFTILRNSIIKSDVVGTAEFLSPFRLDFYTGTGQFVLWQPILFLHLSFVLVVLGAMFGWKRFRCSEWLLLLSFGYLYKQAVKNHGYFVLATLPATAIGLAVFADVVRRRFDRWMGVRRVLGPATLVILPLVSVIMAAQIVNGYWYGLQRAEHRLGGGWNERSLPVRACEFLRSSIPAPERILNNWDAGGYLRFATRWPVFIDGRNEIMGEAFYREYLRFKVLDSLPAMVGKWKLCLALVPTDELPLWLYYFQHAPGWRWIYRDDCYAVFQHESAEALLPALTAPVPGTDYPVFTNEAADAIRRTAEARQSPSLIASVTRPHHASLSEMSESLLWLRSAEPKAAIGHALLGLRESTFPAPDLFATLGHAYYDIGDKKRAAECYRVALRSISDPIALERLRKIDQQIKSNR